MATCPRCRGHLTDSHRCPKSTAKSALEIAAAGLLGGVLGVLGAGWLDPGGQARLAFVSLLAGSLLGIGIHRAVRG